VELVNVFNRMAFRRRFVAWEKLPLILRRGVARAIDAHIAEQKALEDLHGKLPEWVEGTRPGELSATWNVADSNPAERANYWCAST
jgi:hypothetical protein